MAARKGKGAAAARAGIERPVPPLAPVAQFGSDIVAQTLRALDLPFIALNPGASFRGLHDSLVNFLGNERPQMLLCLHEEHAVAIAQGFAKVTGRPMAVAVHSNVGLFHATMAIFNAWCDRMPVVVIGATGPVDSVKRRPWIDWIHTATDQGAIVRSFVKWDAQPASPGAAREALLRATWHAQTAPMGPVYVNLDAHMQEAPLAEPLPEFDVARFVPAAPMTAPAEAIARAAKLLRAARRPLLMVGRVSRSIEAWNARVQLAEALGANVLTDLKVGASFPTDHPLHAEAPLVLMQPNSAAVIADADVILSLDWVDLGGALKVAYPDAPPRAKIIHVSLDHLLHNGWSMDHQALPPVDVLLAGEPDDIVPTLLALLGTGKKTFGKKPKQRAQTDCASPGDAPRVDDLALALRHALGGRATSLSHLPLSWNAATWPFAHPLDFLGSDGGGGIGAGPGIAVGAALALTGSGRIPVAICGDGDFLMGATALWTAVHYRIAVLIVVANNQSFYNDEIHQERVARMRDRPVANKWIGQRIADPAIDIAAMATAQGAVGIGPVETCGDMAAAFADAIAAVDSGRVAVVDVRVKPGYAPVPPAAPKRGSR